MRVYVTGNEDTARYHLPVVQSRAIDFAERCKRAGLSQDAMSFSFEDTGTRVSVQYVFGQLQVQIASPAIDSIPVAKEEDKQAVVPGTFYMETSLGYFWVRVRKDDEGISRVELEPFEAMKPSDDIFSQEFVYPAMGHGTPGMLSGSFGSDGSRYVVSQAGGIFVGKDQEKGTIKMPPTGNGDARLNVQQNDANRGEFCIIDNAEGKSCFFKYIVVSLDDAGEISVKMKHGNIDMLLEGETGGIIPDNLEKIPCWIHRKCSGSYFSPNKTIGYHVDIGSDDDYFGNAWAIPSGIQDKLDNGMEGFSYFNHVKELYRIAPLAAAPLSVNDQFISLLLVSPTMIWDAPTRDEMCWGGYGNTSTTFGCLDQLGDFQRNILAPRFCVVEYNFASGNVVSVTEPLYTSIDIKSWCNFFGASFSSEVTKQCSSKPPVSSFETKEAASPCGWSDEVTIYSPSGGGLIQVSKEVPKEQRYMQHGIYGFEEDLAVHRKIEFRFNTTSYIANPTSRGKNFYFLFDGLWHESMAAMWLTSPTVSNSCGLLAEPAWEQAPGGEVTFVVVGGSTPSGATKQWLAENATEYVDNLQIVAPLAVRNVYFGLATTDQLCFIAKVPEDLEAQHEPVVLVGGITYQSPDVAGETVKCEYALMSAPCICTGSFSFIGALSMNGGDVFVQGGCSPYDWSVTGGSLYSGDVSYGPTVSQTDKKSFQIVVNDYSCSVKLSVIDACGETIDLEAEDIGGVKPIYGPTFLPQGASAKYVHNMGIDAVYSGGLTVVSEDADSAVLQMPSTQTEPVTIGWSGPCEETGSLTVTPGYCHCEDAGAIAWSECSWLNTNGGELGIVGGCGPFTWSIFGGSFVTGGVDIGSSIISTNTRYVEVAVDTQNCEINVSVTDDTCLTTITKETSMDGGGSLTGPEVLPCGNSAWYYHNVVNAVYSGGLVLVQQTENALFLKMPEGTTSVQTISVSGDCDMHAEFEVAPSYCICQDSPMFWGQSSQDIILNGTAHMYFSGGCAPFDWYGSNVDFVDSAGSVIPFSARKSINNLYVRSTNECEGSMAVTDRCGQSLSRSKSILGATGTVVGPSILKQGESGTFYHDLGAGAEYGGTLELVQQTVNGTVLRMPADAIGNYTASWTASCDRSASMTVSSLELIDCNGDGTTMCTLPRSGSGCPSSGYFCYGHGAVNLCVELTGEEVNMQHNLYIRPPSGTYALTSSSLVWYGAPMMTCNLGTYEDGLGPFIWKRGRFVQDLG